MTRTIAIVGTSNIGAVKYAAPAIAAAYPDLALAFWGLPGGKFADCAVDASGCLRTAPGDAKALAVLADMAEQMLRAGSDMARLGGVMRRLVNGERDADALMKGMGPLGRQLLLDILSELGKAGLQ